jgi:hypothetical protein
MITVPDNPRRLNWTPESIVLFDEIKDSVANSEKLHHQDPNRALFVDTDASEYGIAGIIYHLQEETGEKDIISVYSASLDRTQKKWSQAELEAFAMMKVLTAGESYLMGRHFTLRTDARNLTFASKDKNKKIYRWFLSVLPFHFDIIHIPGVQNELADAISRMRCDSPKSESDEITGAWGGDLLSTLV